MRDTKLAQQIFSIGLMLFLLVGCSSEAAATPTSAPPTITFTPTPKPTFTSTPTMTPEPTSTPIPIPPLPTVQALPTYQKPIVQLIDQQGVATTVTLNAYSFGYIVLTIADGIYAEIPWSEFRRAYKTEGNFIVTTADGQELKGQLDSDQNDLKDENGKTLDIQSLSSIVMIGLDSFWLKESSRPVKNTLPGHPWQLHITEPEDLTFIVTQPEFAFEYLATTHDPVFGDTTETAVGLTEAFTLELGGISHHLSSLQEFRRDTASQITIIQANAMETTGGFFPILSLMGHIYKGSTPAWYLRAIWVDYRISIEVKNPRWVLTK